MSDEVGMVMLAILMIGFAHMCLSDTDRWR